jgi:predicted RNA polymerase sigma factor
LVGSLEQWPQSGVPDNAGAWLMATANHRAIDLVRRNKRSERKRSEGIASVDFIAVAARGGSKLAGLTWRVSWLVAAE